MDKDDKKATDIATAGITKTQKDTRGFINPGNQSPTRIGALASGGRPAGNWPKPKEKND